MTNDNSTSSTYSTSSSSLYKRHGLSPRQRRLLQAAARSRANSSPRRQVEEQSSATASPVSPSQITPASLATSLSPIECRSPYDQSFKELTPPQNKSLPSLDHKPHKIASSGSGVSTEITDATTASIRSRFSNIRLSTVNDEGEVTGAMRGQVSDRVKRFNSGANSMNQLCNRLNEEDENDIMDQECVAVKGPLNIQPKLKAHQKQQPNLSPEKMRYGWKNNILKTAAKQMELRYYRVVYPGVVSILSELPSHVTANLLPSKSCNKEPISKTSQVYLGYGEVVATSSPEITISISVPETLDSETAQTQTNEEKKCMRAIRVDSILTGGYNSDDKDCIAPDPSVPASWKTSILRHHGYLLLNNELGHTIAESIPPFKSGSLRPLYEHGSFVYRVRATSPVRVLSGPDFNAPSMKCALIPGTVHDVSFRVSVPVSDTANDGDDDANTILVDDADAGEVRFLRLGHRRGWVLDRRIDAVDGDSNKLRVSYLMQDVTDEQNTNYTSSGQSVAASPNTTLSQSLDCSSLNLSVSASSVATPSTVNTLRKRTKRRRQEAQNVPIMQVGRPGDSFDTESSATGYASGTAVSTGSDYHSRIASIETFHLMRVLAPSGLTILDAPKFQVSNLIHTPTEQSKLRNQSPAGISPFARTNAMIGSSSADSSPSSLGINRKGQRIRFLARGQFFEASNRMESTDAASLYTNGQGLVKLADGSGWVIIPHHQDLVAQYEDFLKRPVDPCEIMAYEEIGAATIQKHSRTSNRLTPPNKTNVNQQWLRIAIPNGVKVLLPPTEQLTNDTKSNTTSPKYPTPGEKAISLRPSSSSHESEVSSAISSSFFDTVWSKVTPTKQKPTASSSATTVIAANKQFERQPLSPSTQEHNDTQLASPVISCGMVVPVESYDNARATSDSTERHFVRLFNGQGWIPQYVASTECAFAVRTPQVRFGSFWFRVESNNGVVVRHGPSLEAPSITSKCGNSFRFECGEFLRASEVLTIYNKSSKRKASAKIECFARLYRKNQSLNTDASNLDMMYRYSSIQYLTFPGEWVLVYNSNELFLEEYSTPPVVERNREGWLCSAIRNVHIRSGPSFRADLVGKVICADEEFHITEKVTTNDAVWLRLKSNEGWVHSISDGNAVVHCHITDYSRRMVNNIMNR